MHREATSVAVFLGVYAVLTIPLALWPSSGSIVGLACYGLYTLLALGMAADLTELVLAVVWRAPHLPRAAGPAVRSRTAVLMTVCDDWVPTCPGGLSALAQVGYDVYVLDDSDEPQSLRCPSPVTDGVVWVRRPVRTGAKAGNLNHWLREFGCRYDNAILLDSDSSMSPAAADALVLAAAHPDNSRVALFQSKIGPAPAARGLFARALRCEARPRAAVVERVHMPLGLLLSFGHNQLLRLAALRAVGSFDETLTAEDTALSLNLRANGWSLALVDVWSTDTDPETVAAHNTRTIRWARQTVELCGRSWTPAPLRLRLLLCRHLLAYALLPLGALLLGLSLWRGPEHLHDVCVFLAMALAFAPGYGIYGVTIVSMIAVSALLLGLRIWLARREGERWHALLVHSVLACAPYATLIVPLAVALAATAFGKSVRFVPTNSGQARRREALLWVVIARWLSSVALVGILVLGALLRPGSLLVGFNTVWLACLVLSPFSQLLAAVIDRWSRANLTFGEPAAMTRLNP